jgi:hypothetical protein
MMEIMHCQNIAHRNAGKIAIIELSNRNGTFIVQTHSVRKNPMKHQRKKLSSKIRLKTDHKETAMSMFNAILGEKQKAGFKFLANGENINIPHFEELFKPKANKPKKQNIEQPTYRKLSV